MSQHLRAPRLAPTRMRSLARDNAGAYLCSDAEKARDSAALAVTHNGTRCSGEAAQTTTRWWVVQVAQISELEERYKILWLKRVSGYKIYQNARDEVFMGRPMYIYGST